MNIRDIIRIRQLTQQLTAHSFREPDRLLSWFGAIQAQDFNGSKWAMGIRLPGLTDQEAERAISDGQIIRTWGLRGTLHFYARKDIHWVRKLVYPRIRNLQASQFRRMGIDESFLRKSYQVLERTMAGRIPASRSELRQALEKKKIPSGDMRLNFVLWKAAIEGLICLGPRRGKEFTYVLLEDWAPSQDLMPRDQSLGELAKRYFCSHGPATVQDFAWWSGLSLSEIDTGLALSGNHLQKKEFGGSCFWMPRNLPGSESSGGSVFLLPCFDEYIIGYRDRSIMLRSEAIHQRVISRNGIFNPSILIRGMVAGTWKQHVKQKSLFIDQRFPGGLKKSWKRPLEMAGKQLGAFLCLDQSPVLKEPGKADHPLPKEPFGNY
jgi:hypothetical protein